MLGESDTLRKMRLEDQAEGSLGPDAVDLDAPVRRVCSREVPVPYAAHLEEAALPQAAGIAAVARGLVRAG